MPDAALIATSAAAGAAVIGLVLRELQHGRKSLEDRVQLAVEAKVGSSLLAFRELENQLRDRVTKAEGVDANLRAVLESGELRLQNLQQLLDRAAEAIPQVEDYGASLPALIVLDIHQTDDAREKTILLGKLLNHPGSSAGELETGGDVARQELLNDELAIRLYKRSTEVDPSRLSARAELLRLQAAETGPDQSAAFSDLLSLAIAHPENRIVVGRALDAFIAADDYRGMKNFIENRLAAYSDTDEIPNGVILWRNLAIARADLGEPFESVAEAYEKSLELAKNSADDGAFVNSARPYSGYLLRMRAMEKARALIFEALERDPTEAQLYIAKAELERREHRFESAGQSLALAHKFGNPTERAIAGRELQRVQAAQAIWEVDREVEEAPQDENAGNESAIRSAIGLN